MVESKEDKDEEQKDERKITIGEQGAEKRRHKEERKDRRVWKNKRKPENGRQE